MKERDIDLTLSGQCSIDDLGDADLTVCYRLLYNRYYTEEECSSEIGEFANSLVTEVRRRGLEIK